MQKGNELLNVTSKYMLDNIFRILLALLFVVVATDAVYPLQPEQVMVIANRDCPQSVKVAQYYCSKRSIPPSNYISLPLGSLTSTTISRIDYNEKIAKPLRVILNGPEFSGKIKCLLTTYGVPISVGGRGKLEGKESDLQRFKLLIEQGEAELKKTGLQTDSDSAEKKEDIKTQLAKLKLIVDMINGKETNASLDSELSMVLYKDYELYRWQPNLLQLKLDTSSIDTQIMLSKFKTLMVSRLDGPGEDIATGLVDKALAAEESGLHGFAYYDSRGMPNNSSYGQYDKSIRDLAEITSLQTELPVKQENTEKLFEPNSCPETAIYCGWYSLRKYVDAFDFTAGAVGVHIASFEAANLRDPDAVTWCPAMLKDGITATFGPVTEPYLQSFPEPKDFFEELFKGSCLAEAYYHTKPYNSWQLVLIGDPLYKPFPKTGRNP